jgi:hypothetical protein
MTICFSEKKGKALQGVITQKKKFTAVKTCKLIYPIRREQMWTALVSKIDENEEKEFVSTFRIWPEYSFPSWESQVCRVTDERADSKKESSLSYLVQI